MGWKFEVAKMSMYVMFPVAIFHYFNQPSNYEEWVKRSKKKYFPVQSRQTIQEMEDFIYEFNQTNQQKHLEEMENQYKLNQ